jgi:type I restriction enzyme M protein
MIALPGQLFYSTPIPACLWFLAGDKSGKTLSPIPMGEGRGEGHRLRARRGQVLFIDARKLGRMVDRTHRELTDAEISRLAGVYHLWRGEKSVHPEHVEGRTEYADIPGFCKSATLDDIRKHSHVLTPGRYVGAEVEEDDGEPFEQKMIKLSAQLRQQIGEGITLDAAIVANLKDLGYGR